MYLYPDEISKLQIQNNNIVHMSGEETINTLYTHSWS
jgi:hypothetical protein